VPCDRIDAEALVAAARALDACSVSDALDRLGLEGAVIGLRPLSVPPRLVGTAITVQLARYQPDQPKPGRHLGTAAVEACRPGDVIVVAADSVCDAAAWGGILSLGAKLNGAAGVVVDGAVRDVDEAVQLELPIYGRAPVQRTARGRLLEVDWDCRVNMAGVAVRSGDLVIADRSGVVFVSLDVAARVLDVAASIKLREDDMAAKVRAGSSISEVMNAQYENMLRGDTAP
jgi:4-hydroxy-4-methyl-2-oxoglutarate aldolase